MLQHGCDAIVNISVMAEWGCNYSCCGVMQLLCARNYPVTYECAMRRGYATDNAVQRMIEKTSMLCGHFDFDN
jgi:hypothetical protein